jgi:hypothetical protein
LKLADMQLARDSLVCSMLKIGFTRHQLHMAYLRPNEYEFMIRKNVIPDSRQMLMVSKKLEIG